MKYGMILGCLVFLASPVRADNSEKIEGLEEKVEALEKRIAALESSSSSGVSKKSTSQPAATKMDNKQLAAQQQQKARARMLKDSSVYSKAELREIESLYQVANEKWRTKQGKDSLKLLVDKFDESNRTGCALLYLGQMSRGDEREEYLEEAIDDYSDCYYGNGVQVGAYARFLLAYHYKETGEEDDAEELLDEIKSDFPDAISHQGERLVDLIGK